MSSLKLILYCFEIIESTPAFSSKYRQIGMRNSFSQMYLMIGQFQRNNWGWLSSASPLLPSGSQFPKVIFKVKVWQLRRGKREVVEDQR